MDNFLFAHDFGFLDVGKTSLSMRYCHGSFPENTTSTIGASFLQKRMFVGETDVSLQIWDTAGISQLLLL